MTEKYYKPIQAELENYFYNLYWKDILQLLKESERLYNSNSALISAIRKGLVHYESGVFSGKYNSAISKDLRKFAKYDARSKTWKGIPPGNVTAAATIANERGKKLAMNIESLIAEIPSRVSAVVESLKYSIDAPLFMMSDEAGKDLKSIGVSIDMTPELSDRLIEEYTTNQNINIKNWTTDQTIRLRKMIEKNALSGYNRLELQELISSEYGVSMAKAKFLARQETTLFTSTVRDERYSSAGITLVKWSTSQDARVVGNPSGLYPDPSKGHGDHFALNGKICKLNDPSVYADSIAAAKAGKWKSKVSAGMGNEHAGKEYGCRCTYIPIIV